MKASLREKKETKQNRPNTTNTQEIGTNNGTRMILTHSPRSKNQLDTSQAPSSTGPLLCDFIL